jgi:hypothetical protein
MAFCVTRSRTAQRVRITPQSGKLVVCFVRGLMDDDFLGFPPPQLISAQAEIRRGKTAPVSESWPALLF